MTPYTTLHVRYVAGCIEYRLEGSVSTSGPIRHVVRHPISESDLAVLLATSTALLQSTSTANFEHEARQCGDLLYRTLIPEQIRGNLAAVTEPLLINTSMYGLPFELFHDGSDFWGLKYALGKQIDIDRAAYHRPVSQTERFRTLIVSSDPRGDVGAAHAEAERVFANVAAFSDAFVLAGEAASFAMVVAMLGDDKGFDLIHYCGHVVGHGAAGSGLLLTEERVLSAKVIESTLKGCPLVFLNGCASAHNALSSLADGWEKAVAPVTQGFLIGGARAVVGTYADVGDGEAAVIAIEFYRRVAGGEPIGEALRLARAHGRSVVPQSPSWLSFVLYGNPAEVLVERATESFPPSRGTRPRRGRETILILSGAVTLLLCVCGALWWQTKPWAYLSFRYHQAFDDTATVEEFWKVKDALWSFDIADGRYCLANRDDKRAAHYIHVGFLHTDVSEAPVSAEIQAEGATEAAKAGLLYRFNQSTKEYYAFVLSASGEWGFYKRIKGLNINQALVKGRTSTEPRNFNKLAIVGTGPRLDLYVNGRRVTSVQDHQLTTGDSGIIVMSIGKFCFDNFSIHEK